MEAEWLRSCFSDKGTLHIVNPVAGQLFGYRKYKQVILENIESLWFEDVPNFLGVINSAMEYPSTLKIHLHHWDGTKPQFDASSWRVESWVSGKGFINVRREGDWIIAEKG